MLNNTNAILESSGNFPDTNSQKAIMSNLCTLIIHSLIDQNFVNYDSWLAVKELITVGPCLITILLVMKPHLITILLLCSDCFLGQNLNLAYVSMCMLNYIGKF